METEKLSDYDAAWKEALDEYFPEFMELFFPNAYKDINWAKKYEILDKELQTIVHNSNLGKRHADKLIKVFLNDGTETVILIHIEVQGDYDSNFSERMYVYNYRIFDKYFKLGQSNIDLVSFAVLGDFNDNWQPSTYGRSRWNCDLSFNFPTVKLNKYRKELENSKNPFALIALSYLKSKETHNDYDKRLIAKIELFRKLFSIGWEKEQVIGLLNFVDWMVALPKSLHEQFQVELEKFDGEVTMPYINSFERNGIEKGMQEGQQQGVKNSISLVLKAKFKLVPESIKNEIEKISSTEELEKLLLEIIDIKSLEDFEKLLHS